MRPSAGSETFVSAAVYRLGKAYTPAQFGAAAKELDRVAARLATAAGGKVVSGETTSIGGRRVRSYRFTAAPKGGGATDDRVAFVLAGRREVQLLCQAPRGAGDPDGACGLLYGTFSLGGAG